MHDTLALFNGKQNEKKNCKVIIHSTPKMSQNAQSRSYVKMRLRTANDQLIDYSSKLLTITIILTINCKSPFTAYLMARNVLCMDKFSTV